MMFRVSTYEPSKDYAKEVFYIQSKGLNAGRPLREPKRNCWVIETDINNAFEICTVLWISKIFEVHLCGSVIPFLRINDFRKIAIPYLQATSEPNEKLKNGLQSLFTIDCLINNTLNKLKLVTALKISTASQLLKEIQMSHPQTKKASY